MKSRFCYVHRNKSTAAKRNLVSPNFIIPQIEILGILDNAQYWFIACLKPYLMPN